MSLMFNHLHIYDDRERALVGLADLIATPLGWRRATRDAGPVRRVLLLRLERIGDLLMVLDAIADARAAWPDAEIDLAVGSWNMPIARLIPGISKTHLMNVPWLSREGGGDGWPALISKARAWKKRDYDVAVNFEPDIRSNFLCWLSGARTRYGYWTGGGGAFLTSADAYEPAQHVSSNAKAL